MDPHQALRVQISVRAAMSIHCVPPWGDEQSPTYVSTFVLSKAIPMQLFSSTSSICNVLTVQYALFAVDLCLLYSLYILHNHLFFKHFKVLVLFLVHLCVEGSFETRFVNSSFKKNPVEPCLFDIVTTCTRRTFCCPVSSQTVTCSHTKYISTSVLARRLSLYCVGTIVVHLPCLVQHCLFSIQLQYQEVGSQILHMLRCISTLSSRCSEYL